MRCCLILHKKLLSNVNEGHNLINLMEVGRKICRLVTAGNIMQITLQISEWKCAGAFSDGVTYRYSSSEPYNSSKDSHIYRIT
jgi:hypothetical protein